jgi:hypothetical protein
MAIVIAAFTGKVFTSDEPAFAFLETAKFALQIRDQLVLLPVPD